MDFIPLQLDWNDIAARSLHVTLILVGALAAYLVLRSVRGRISALGETGSYSDRLQRRKTLGAFVTTVGIIVIVAVATMMILDEVGLSLGPLLATAGIAGLAIGFGAQTVVKDFLSGVFILLEDQYGIGDVIRTAEVEGRVEEVNLRSTVLRDIRGVVHVVPNGEIRVVSNMTKEWSRAVLEIGVDYEEDPDRVIKVLEDLAEEVFKDPVFGSQLLEKPTVPGVEAFDDSAVRIRMMATTRPLRQWDVAREIRRRIKHRFDAEGIKIPFPQRTVWHRDAS